MMPLRASLPGSTWTSSRAASEWRSVSHRSMISIPIGCTNDYRASERCATPGPAPATPTGVLDAILGDAPVPPGGAALAKAPALPELDNRADGGLAEFVQRV